jgi:hypothetical protein
MHTLHPILQLLRMRIGKWVVFMSIRDNCFTER